MKGSHRLSLSAAQEVRSFRERVGSVKVLVQPVGELWSNGPHSTDVVCDGLEVAHVEAVQLMPSHGKVNDRWLLGVDMNSVEVSILLGRNGSSILDSDHLQEELRGRCSRNWRRRGRRDLRWWWGGQGRRRRGLGGRRVLWLRCERRRNARRWRVWWCGRQGRHDWHPVRPGGRRTLGRRVRGRRRGRRFGRRGNSRWRARWRRRRRWSVRRRRRAWNHGLSNCRNVIEGGDRVALSAAQEVGAFRKLIRPVPVLVQPVR